MKREIVKHESMEGECQRRESLMRNARKASMCAAQHLYKHENFMPKSTYNVDDASSHIEPTNQISAPSTLYMTESRSSECEKNAHPQNRAMVHTNPPDPPLQS